MEETDAIIVACTAFVVCSLGAATLAVSSQEETETLTCTRVKQYITDRHRYGACTTLLPEAIRAVFQDGRQYILCPITRVHYGRNL